MKLINIIKYIMMHAYIYTVFNYVILYNVLLIAQTPSGRVLVCIYSGILYYRHYGIACTVMFYYFFCANGRTVFRYSAPAFSRGCGMSGQSLITYSLTSTSLPINKLQWSRQILLHCSILGKMWEGVSIFTLFSRDLKN